MSFNWNPENGRWVMGGSGNGVRRSSSSNNSGPLFGKYSKLISNILIVIGLCSFAFLVASIFLKMFGKSFPGIFILYGFIVYFLSFMFAKEKHEDLFGEYTELISNIFAIIALLCFLFFLVSIFLTIFIETFSSMFILSSFLLFLVMIFFSKVINDEPLLDF